MAAREDDSILFDGLAVRESFSRPLDSSDDQSSICRDSSSIHLLKQVQDNSSQPNLPVASQFSSRMSSDCVPPHNPSGISYEEITEEDSWTIVDSSALNRPSAPSSIQQAQSTELDNASSSTVGALPERLRPVLLDPPSAQSSFYPPSLDLSQIVTQHDRPHSSLIPHSTQASSTKEAFSSTAEHSILTVDPPFTSEQPQVSASVTPHCSRRGSIEASGLLPDAPTAHFTADSSEPPPRSRPSTEDSEQIFSTFHSQDLILEHLSETLHRSAEQAQNLLAAAEAGRAAWYKLKRKRSSSSSTPSEEMTGPTSPAWVKERLEQHNMLQDLGAALARFPRLQSAVGKIISRDRKSAASQKEFQKFKGKLEFYQNQNEDSLLAMVLPAIIRDDRTIQVPKEGLSDEAIWESVDFFESGVVTIVNREFQRGYVPFRNGVHHIDTELVAKMAKLKDQGMTNPKPDRAYGTRRDKFKVPTQFQMPKEVRDYLEILQDLHLPFLIVEGKAEGGSSAEARNQACRGGAVLVHSHRLLRALLGMEDKVGADLETYVFSATYSDGLLDIWVHWAEVREEEFALPIYHMSLVASKAIREEDQFRQARMILYNVLDWGSNQRFVGLKPLHEAIIAYSASQQKQAEAEKFGNAEKSGEGGKEEPQEHKKQKTTHP
ncbi:MAG: hypothetical protein Q9188_007477 [Gyalolechia gomerana]